MVIRNGKGVSPSRLPPQAEFLADFSQIFRLRLRLLGCLKFNRLAQKSAAVLTYFKIGKSGFSQVFI